MKEAIVKNTIILIRHGESDFNVEGIIQGNTDFSRLTKRGIKQAEIIGKWINELEINYVYSSPLIRALNSAEIIANECGKNLKEIIIDKRLEEIDFGIWQGQKREIIKEKNQDLYHFWRKRPFDFNLDQKYPVRDMYDRVNSFLNEYVLLDSKKGIKVIIGHKGTISAILVLLLKLPKSHHHFLQIDRGSVTVLQERTNASYSDDFELIFANELPKEDNNQPINFEVEERTMSKGEVFLIRHGHTSSNIDKRYQGSINIPLSNLGIKGMTLLADSFTPRHPTRIYSSPLIRAKKSANIIANKFGVISLGVRSDLHELLYGIWEGMTENEVIKYRNEEYNQWQVSPADVLIPQAEHLINAYNRCSRIWDDYQLDIESWGGSIISVAHDIVNRLIICNALDLPPNYIWAFKQTNASVSVIAVKAIYDGRLRMLNHSINSLKYRLSDEWL